MKDWPEVLRVPGASAMLEQLHGRYRLVLASNAVDSDPVAVRQALDRVGLGQWINEIHCPATLNTGKTGIAYYQRLLSLLGLTPAQCVMVGDDWHADVLLPTALGMRAIWFNRRGPERPAGHLFASMGQLAELPAMLCR